MGSIAPAAGADLISLAHIHRARRSASKFICQVHHIVLAILIIPIIIYPMMNTVQINSKTAIARSVLKEKLAGRSSLERGRERALTALTWVYRWGWASSTTLEMLVGTQRSGLAQRLVKSGLLVSTKTQSRRNEKFLPGSFLTLTQDGKHMVEVDRMEPMPYEHRPERVNQNHLMHNEMAQRFTAERLIDGTIVDYLTEKEMKAKSQNGVKNPDVVWLFPDGKKVSVEIELSPKWERDLDTFVLSSLVSLSCKNGPAHFDQLQFITDAPAILKRYQKAFTPGASFRTWRKNESGRWTADEERFVPSWTNERITWELV